MSEKIVEIPALVLGTSVQVSISHDTNNRRIIELDISGTLARLSPAKALILARVLELAAK